MSHGREILSSTPSGDVQVRRASFRHLAAIVGFNAAMAKETEGKELDLDLLRPGVEAVLTRDDLGFYLVAEQTGRAVGQLLITYEWSDWRNAFFWWIQSVYVSPDSRRFGVYKALHDHASTEARRQGNVCGLRLYVDKNNRVAQGVYGSLGMHLAHYDMYEIEF
jgi:GNAT superfamily N-acetyltransferase